MIEGHANLDALEHDSVEDAPRSVLPTGLASSVKNVGEDLTNAVTVQRRQIRGQSDRPEREKPWLSEDNDALFEGEVDDD